MRESEGRFSWYEGLKGRFILVIVLLIIAQGVLIGLYAGYQSKRSLEAELVKRGKTLIRMLSTRKIGFLMYQERKDDLDAMIESLVEEPDVVYIAFTDPTGEMVAYSKSPFHGIDPNMIINEVRQMGLEANPVYPFPMSGRAYFDFHKKIFYAGAAGAVDEGVLSDGFEDVEPRAKAGKKNEVGVVHIGISGESTAGELRSTLMAITGIVFLIVFIACVVALIFAGRIVKPIRRMVDVAVRIAKGDYSQTIKAGGRDEVGLLSEAFKEMQKNLMAIAGQARLIAEGDLSRRVEMDGDLATAFNQMVDSLSGLVGQLKKAGIQISSSSNEILAASKQQERGSAEQASSINETTATMDELLSASKQIAASADAVVKIAERTLNAARAGQEAVEEAIKGMDEIRANNKATADRIMELSEKNQQIGNIVDIIDEIADKSDLLALNAAIEGAKAGEAGKGFSVVAVEMRSLAENVVESTKEIKEIINEIQRASQASVLATEGQMKTTEEGATLAGKTGEQLSRIVGMAEQTTESAKQISLATQQQRTGTEQVVHSMEGIAGIAKQNVSGSGQTTQSTLELSSLADELKNTISRFRLTGD